MARKTKKIGKAPLVGRQELQTQAGRTVQPSKKASCSKADKTSAWLREYYLPDYSIQRAARDLLSHSTFEVIEDFA